MNAEAGLRALRGISGFLGLSLLMFGVLKFVDPFRSWYEAQITLSGLPGPAYFAGIAAEVAVGAGLLASLLGERPGPSASGRTVGALSSVGILGIMGVATIVHLHPQVPAEVLPLKIKPPVIPAFFMLLALINLALIALEGRKEPGKTIDN